MPEITFSNIVDYLVELGNHNPKLEQTFRWNISEASGAMRSGYQGGIIMAVDSPEIQSAGDNSKLFHNNSTAFTILGQPDKVDDTESQNKILNECLSLCFEFERRILSDARTPKINGEKNWMYGLVDKSSFSFQKGGPVYSDGLFGYRCELVLKNQAPQRVDDANWNDLPAIPNQQFFAENNAFNVVATTSIDISVDEITDNQSGIAGQITEIGTPNSDNINLELIDGTTIRVTSTSTTPEMVSFSYKATNGIMKVSGSVFVNVAFNSLAVAVDDYYEINQGETVEVDVLGNDYDEENDDFFLHQIVQDAIEAVSVISGNTEIQITPSQWYEGTDFLIYKLIDAQGRLSVGNGIVNLLIKPVFQLGELFSLEKLYRSKKYYSGNNSRYVNCGGEIGNNATKLSISVRFRKPSGGMCSLGSQIGTTNGWWFSWYTDNQMYWTFRNGSASGVRVLKSDGFGEWLRITVNYDGTKPEAERGEIIIDKVKQNVIASGILPSSLSADAGTNLQIGAIGSANLTTGDIDDVVIIEGETATLQQHSDLCDGVHPEVVFGAIRRRYPLDGDYSDKGLDAEDGVAVNEAGDPFTETGEPIPSGIKYITDPTSELGRGSSKMTINFRAKFDPNSNFNILSHGDTNYRFGFEYRVANNWILAYFRNNTNSYTAFNMAGLNPYVENEYWIVYDGSFSGMNKVALYQNGSNIPIYFGNTHADSLPEDATGLSIGFNFIADLVSKGEVRNINIWDNLAASAQQITDCWNGGNPILPEEIIGVMPNRKYRRVNPSNPAEVLDEGLDGANAQIIPYD